MSMKAWLQKEETANWAVLVSLFGGCYLGCQLTLLLLLVLTP